MKEKLTTVEKRAQSFCAGMIQYDGGLIGVEWKRSRMYGHNPVILTHGGKCTSVSGCGYDKLSTALAQCLRFLFPVGSEQYSQVWRSEGAGLGSVQDKLKAFGWNLERTVSGSAFDGFKLSRIAP